MAKLLIVKWIFVIFLISASVVCAQENNTYFSYKGSLQNFTIGSQTITTEQDYVYNFTRFRTDLDGGIENTITYKIIFDIENYLDYTYLTSPDYQLQKDVMLDIPIDPYGEIIDEDNQILRSYLYRAYATMYLFKSDYLNDTLRLGFQRIALGVGRIWNPTDILNPPNPLSLEPTERLGVVGVEYTRPFSDLTQLQVFLTSNNDSETKDYGFRAKSNVAQTDIALTVIKNDINQMTMTGCEIEREVFNTGIGARSEIAFFNNEKTDEQNTKYITGFDFGVPNTSIYVLFEYLYNENGETDPNKYNMANLNLMTWDQLAQNYCAITYSFEVTSLIYNSNSLIYNINDNSYSVAKSIKINLDDNVDMNLQATLFNGAKNTEFFFYNNIYSINFSIYF
ncbi:hypothetical protein ACFL56_00065 [Candidatus Margulisiibacteriota bacterium]